MDPIHRAWRGSSLLCLVFVVAACTAGPNPVRSQSTPAAPVSEAPSSSPVSPAATPTSTPVSTPTPTPTPDPVGFELGARITAFAPAAAKATERIAKKVPTIQDVPHFVAFDATLEPLSRLVGKEQDWAYERLGQPDIPASCALFVLWWNTAGAGSTSSLDGYQGATPEMETESRYFTAIFNVDSSNQRKLDKARAALVKLNKRVAALAVTIESSSDPCSVTGLPK